MRRTLSHFSVSYSENDSDSDDCQCSDGAMFVCKQQRLDRHRHRRSLNQLRLQLQPAHLRWFSFSGWPAALSPHYCAASAADLFGVSYWRHQRFSELKACASSTVLHASAAAGCHILPLATSATSATTATLATSTLSTPAKRLQFYHNL